MIQIDTTPTITEINQIPDRLMATILEQVVSFKRQHEGLIHVVKASGKIVDHPVIRENFAKQIVAMRRDLGLKVVVVHGAGKQIDAALNAAKFVSRKENGLRITEADHIETIDRVVRDTNKTLCNMFADVSKGDVLPLGMPGYHPDVEILGKPIDAANNNFSASQIVSVNPWRMLHLLNDPKVIPVITNMCAIDEEHENASIVNVNADTVASALAISLKAHRLLMCSDVPGVLDKENKVIAEIAPHEVAGLKASGILGGGMLVKVNEAFATAGQMKADSGVVIMDENFLMELLTPKGHGTMFRAFTPASS